MAKIIEWGPEETKKKLKQRLTLAKRDRDAYEYRWSDSERIVYRTNQAPYSNTVDSAISSYGAGIDKTPDYNGEDYTVGYCMKNLRFIHAQLSANPPSVVVKPATSDQDDHTRAQLADKIVRHFIRAYNMQEVFDRCTLNTLLYGTGFIKTVWDPHKGDILEVDDEGNLTMEGDISISTPSPWDVFVDPDAECWEDVTYIFHRIKIPLEEALYLYPQHADKLKALEGKEADEYSRRGIQSDNYADIEIFEYWEKGAPYNGFLGRFGVMLEDGYLLESIRDNPFKVKGPHDVVPKAMLPFHILTDIDVPNRVWGRSFIEWAAPLQDNLNKLDSAQLGNMEAHSAPRLILPEATEIEDDAIDNNPWSYIKIKGNQPPYFMSAPPVIPQMDNLRAQLKADVDDMSGVNPAMFGQMQRETSGTSLQYATNQGNMIRRRLFNKYVLLTESVYKALLSLARDHWDTEKEITVVGKEKALETITLKGSDIQYGFDIVVEYGTSLSLDPTTRREEILTLSPLLEKAGINPKQQLRHLKLNDLEGVFDANQLAEDRQKEYFAKILATNSLIPPREFEDHENMLAYCLQYVMTKEFEMLSEEQKQLIEEHIRQRKAMAAQVTAAAQGAPSGQLPPEGIEAGAGAGAPVGAEEALPMQPG